MISPTKQPSACSSLVYIVVASLCVPKECACYNCLHEVKKKHPSSRPSGDKLTFQHVLAAAVDNGQWLRLCASTQVKSNDTWTLLS